MKFREQRGGLDESMATCIELADRDALVTHLKRELGKYHYGFEPHLLKVEPYARDDRIGWLDTHIVSIDGYGVVGFTDGPAHSAGPAQ
jgi:hypothetical protein